MYYRTVYCLQYTDTFSYMNACNVIFYGKHNEVDCFYFCPTLIHERGYIRDLATHSVSRKTSKAGNKLQCLICRG